MKFIKRAKEMAQHPLIKVDPAKPGSDWTGLKSLSQIAKDEMWGPFGKEQVEDAFAATKLKPFVGPSSYLFNKISDVVYLQQIKDVIHYETEYDIEHMHHKVLIHFMHNGKEHVYTIAIPVDVVQVHGGEAKLQQAMDVVLGPLKKSKQKSYATIPASAISAGSVSAASIAMPKPDPVKILDAFKQMTTSEKKELAQLIAPFLQTDAQQIYCAMQPHDLQKIEAYFAHKFGCSDKLDGWHPFKLMPPPEWEVQQQLLATKASIFPIPIKVKQS